MVTTPPETAGTVSRVSPWSASQRWVLPSKLGGFPRRIAHAEAHALVGRVGPQVHHASAALQVNLEPVPARVLVHAGLVALVRGGVVEPRLREREVRGDGVGLTP